MGKNIGALVVCMMIGTLYAGEPPVNEDAVDVGGGLLIPRLHLDRIGRGNQFRAVSPRFQRDSPRGRVPSPVNSPASDLEFPEEEVPWEESEE